MYGKAQLAKRILVYGRVQGVGFRPSVCVLAAQLGLKGFVRNLGGWVEVAAQGAAAALEKLEERIKAMPEPADVERLAAVKLTEAEFACLYKQASQGRTEAQDFFAVNSLPQEGASMLTADIAVCASCLEEMHSPGNRRYGYPYISCTHCGPRYTIMEALPYDRENTSMKKFSLCSACQEEYNNVTGKRAHGETISCHECGPQLYAYLKNGEKLEQEAALVKAQELLAQGSIIMVKSLGGYNLVCSAVCEGAVAELRRLKVRPTKPFAVMVSSVEAAARLCYVNEAEQRLLSSRARPIVLLQPKNDIAKQLAEGVVLHSSRLGVFLPPMGLYDELCSLGKPLVVTSCNYSGAPIIYKDGEAEQYFAEHDHVAAVFAYDRDILRPADDAVVKTVANAAQVDEMQLLRRTRGYMPEPIKLPNTEICSENILAVGAHMEPCFSLAAGNKVYLAQVPGDLEESKTEAHWLELVEDWQRLLHIVPQLVVGDLHPGYAATALGCSLAEKIGVPMLQVQHHHAHALAVMAEYGLKGPVLAVCFDGTGYGSDGTIWGGEFLLCKGTDFKRVAHVQPTLMISGNESMKQAWKSALCYLAAAAQAGLELDENELNKFDGRYALVKTILEQKLNTVYNSSMGRVFDAAAAILGLGDYNSHQGCCAQAVEEMAAMAIKEGLAPLDLKFAAQCQAEAAGIIWSPKELLTELFQIRQQADKCSQNAKQKLLKQAALGVHKAIAAMVTATAQELGKKYGIRQIALGGGCFANSILLENCIAELRRLGFEVYYNQQVPPGDGGIVLGQAYYGLLLKDR